MNRRTTTAVLLATGLLATGCSTTSDDKPHPTDAPANAVRKAARAYQEAANRLDWTTACRLSAERLRRGTVTECAANHPDTAPTTPTTPPDPEPSFAPPTYADGSTPEPADTTTPAGPERADTGPVTARDVVTVPAAGDHPAGYGVLITYTVHWPNEPATTTRRALRLVDVGGEWRVDQHEPVHDRDAGHGSPIRAALTGG